jgi:hypothetical protein
MDGGDRRSKVRSFALGGVLGAAGAIAAVRRRSPVGRRPRAAGPGLTAFEDAPCFLELLGEEAQRYREAGAEIANAPSNRE